MDLPTNTPTNNAKHLNTKYPSNNPMDIQGNILKILKKEKIVTSSEVAEKAKVSWNTAERYLLTLVIEGKADKLKKAGVNLWIAK